MARYNERDFERAKDSPLRRWARNRVENGPERYQGMHPWTRIGMIIGAIATAYVVLVGVISQLLPGDDPSPLPRAIASAIAVMTAYLIVRFSRLSGLKWLRYLIWAVLAVALPAAFAWCWLSPWSSTDVYNYQLVEALALICQYCAGFLVGGLVAALVSSYLQEGDSLALSRAVNITAVASCIAGIALAMWLVSDITWAPVVMWTAVAVATIASIGVVHQLSRR